MTPERYERFLKKHFNMCPMDIWNSVFKREMSNFEFLLRTGIPEDCFYIREGDTRTIRVFNTMITKWLLLNKDWVILRLL